MCPVQLCSRFKYLKTIVSRRKVKRDLRKRLIIVDVVVDDLRHLVDVELKSCSSQTQACDKLHVTC